MKEKDLKEKFQKEEYNIPDLKEEIKSTSIFKNRSYEEKQKKFAFTRNSFRLSFSALIVVLIGIYVFVSISQKQTEVAYNYNVNYFSSYSEYNDLLDKYMLKNVAYDEADFYVYGELDNFIDKDGAVNDSNGAPPIAPEDGEMSSTNNQLANVDEADIVKSDGKKIYRLNGNRLLVNEVEKGEIKDTKKVVLGGDGVYGAQMYLTDKYVVVVLQYRELQVKIFSKEDLSIKREYKAACSYLADSRIVHGEDDVLYLVFNQYIKRENGNKYGTPCEYVDGEEHKFDYKEVCYFYNFEALSITMLVSIKLDDNLNVVSKAQLGATNWTAIYVNEKSIYLASVLYQNRYNRNMFYGFGFAGDSQLTSIIKYEINNGEITPIATLTTKGRINNQFYMDEKDDVLRVALSIKGNNKVETYKVIKDEEGKDTFTLLGKIDKNLGEENEEIKSVTFKDDYCLVVTAKSTDPMYKIDLTDPKNPVILGKFKEDGFNSYLQYLKGDLDGLAFGVGYLTHDINEYYNVKDKTKLGLYDVTGDNPIQLDLITYDTTYGVEAAYNHKALFVYKDMIGFGDGNSYYLYKVEKGEDGNYKFNEELKYNLIDNDNEIIYFVYTMSTRMYYIDGYLYLAASNEYGYDQRVLLVSFDMDFKEVMSVNQ